MRLIKWLISTAVSLIILLVILFVAIGLVNNGIARKIEAQLKEYDLPKDTVILDSVSFAEKLTGNGNGMQYTGVILVESDLTREQLVQHYEKDFTYIEVKKQDSSLLSFDLKTHEFENYVQSDNSYVIICYGERGIDNGFISFLLDLDLRGH